MTKYPFEKILSKKLKEINSKIKTSFVLIRKDVDEMKTTVEAMRKYLKKKDKQYNYAKKEDNKIREEFRKDVGEFTQKISQLKLALSNIREIEKEVVTKKHLARIEDRIKNSFKNQIEGYKGQIKELKEELKKSEKRISAIKEGNFREKRD